MLMQRRTITDAKQITTHYGYYQLHFSQLEPPYVVYQGNLFSSLKPVAVIYGEPAAIGKCKTLEKEKYG